MYPNWQEMEITITENNITLLSDILKREVTCTLLMPQEHDLTEPLNLLLLNDGQETDNLGLREILGDLLNSNRISPVLVVAIHAGEERLQEYGTAGKPDFKKRGSKAALYTEFIKTELLPAVAKLTGTGHFNSVVYAGFSLGGLSALDIAWHNPAIFDKAGVFSGSFWWRSRDLSKGYTDNDRIMHGIVRETAVKPDIEIWLQTGTKDELSDRNKNGIIDSVDDTVDLISELELKGFSRPADVQYLEMVGGSHNTDTWARAMPKFLVWAFGRQVIYTASISNKMQHPEDNPWKITGEKVIYDNPWINLTEYQVINPSGNPGIYGKVHYKNIAIGVLPLDDELNTYLVGQYRFALDQYSWEIPEGGGPIGIDPLDSAKRELLEETGLKALNWKEIQRTHLSNSVSDELCILYLARNLQQFEADPEDTEQLIVNKIPFEEVYGMVCSGAITDSLTVAAVLKVKLMLLAGKIV